MLVTRPALLLLFSDCGPTAVHCTRDRLFSADIVKIWQSVVPWSGSGSPVPRAISSTDVPCGEISVTCRSGSFGCVMFRLTVAPRTRKSGATVMGAVTVWPAGIASPLPLGGTTVVTPNELMTDTVGAYGV